MALQGKYNYKGLDISEAYVKVDTVNYNSSYKEETVEKTAAKYNEDGTIKSAAVTEVQWVENNVGSWSAKVYKDKAARDANPLNFITVVSGNMVMAKNAGAKNPVVQAYVAVKAMDEYKDYTDV